MATRAPDQFRCPVLLYAACGSLTTPLVLILALGLFCSHSDDDLATQLYILSSMICAGSFLAGVLGLFGLPNHGARRILPPALMGMLLSLGLGYLCITWGAAGLEDRSIEDMSQISGHPPLSGPS